MRSTRRAGSTRRALLAALVIGLPARAVLAQPRLFRSDDTLSVTLRTDLRALLRDKDTSNAPWRQATLSYAGPDSAVRVPLRVRTRGIYRLFHCDLIPIRLRFSDSTSRGTLFHGLGRPKLVNACRNSRDYEQYVLEEYAIYRVLRLLTPISLSARLLRVTYEDTTGRVRPMTLYAFVTEDPDRFAERLGGTYIVQNRMLGQLSLPDVALFGVFQYFIGNTDWSMVARHNVALLKVGDVSHPLSYDFDWSGVIDAPYAVPNKQLDTRSVTQRLYRAFCVPSEFTDSVLTKFEAVRDSITAIYRSIPGLEPKSVERTLSYYNEFYQAIANHQRFIHRVVEEGCQQ